VQAGQGGRFVRVDHADGFVSRSAVASSSPICTPSALASRQVMAMVGLAFPFRFGITWIWRRRRCATNLPASGRGPGAGVAGRRQLLVAHCLELVFSLFELRSSLDRFKIQYIEFDFEIMNFA
jgi:hypothetical protein